MVANNDESKAPYVLDTSTKPDLASGVGAIALSSSSTSAKPAGQFVVKLPVFSSPNEGVGSNLAISPARVSACVSAVTNCGVELEGDESLNP